MYTTQFPMQMYLPFGQTPPYVRQINRSIPLSISDPWLGTPPFTPNQPGGNPFASGFHNNDLPLPGNTSFATPLSIAAISQNFKLGNVQKWNLTLEHSFGENSVARASYVGEKGTHLSIGRQYNPAIYVPGQCGPVPCSTAANTDARRLYDPGTLGSVLVAESTGYSKLQRPSAQFRASHD
jgi:hypothetical protein